MLQHFTYQSLYENSSLPGWTFSFLYKNEKFNGEYMPNGDIKWLSKTPPNEQQINQMIHELMTFHVYD